MLSVRPFVAIVALLAIVSSASAESIDNPAFKSWAGQKKGTVLTTKMVSEFGGNKTEITMIYTLAEVSDDAITLEMVSVSKIGTMEFKAPATKLPVKKTLELPPGKKKEDLDKPEGLVDQGTETIKVDGVEYKTKWRTIKSKANGNDFESKIWTCDDVPNLVVKMEQKTKIKDMTNSTTMELVSVKKP